MQGGFHPGCPNEAELLAFCEHDLPGWKRSRLEKHLGDCEACRESIAMMVTLNRTHDQDSQELGAVGEDLIRKQTARIVAIAGNDEVRRTKTTETRGAGSTVPGRARTVFGIPISSRLMLATAALVVVLLAVPVVFWTQFRPSPTQQAMQALVMATRPGRHSAMLVSGIPYAPDITTRGGANSDDLMFQKAESKVKFALDPSASPEERHTLARVWLARNEGNDAQNALALLNQIVSSGVAAPETLNDIGVAQFDMGKYDEAIVSFNKALKRSPGFREALFNRAGAEKASALFTESIRSFEDFMHTNPDADWGAEADNNLRTLKSLSPSLR